MTVRWFNRLIGLVDKTIDLHDEIVKASRPADHPYRVAAQVPPIVDEPKPQPKKADPKPPKLQDVGPALTKWDHLIRELRTVEPDVTARYVNDILGYRMVLTYKEETGFVYVDRMPSDSDLVDHIFDEIDRMKAEHQLRSGPSFAGKPKKLRTR